MQMIWLPAPWLPSDMSPVQRTGDTAPTAPEHREHRDSLSLLILPPLALELIWHGLRDGAGGVKSNRHQHALRCACKAMRDLSTPLISCSGVRVIVTVGQAVCVGYEAEVLRQSEQQLAAFPSGARCHSLTWTVRELKAAPIDPFTDDEPDDDEEVDPHAFSGVLPLAMRSCGHKVASLLRLVFSGWVLEGRDLTALVLACPALTDLTLERVVVSGPTLLPLSKLRGLRSLSLTPYVLDYPSLCEGLAPLTLLTSLECIYDTSWWQQWQWSDQGSYSERAGLAPPEESADADVGMVLSAITTLRGLKELSLQVRLSDPRDVSCLHQLSSLTALTSLTLDGLGISEGEAVEAVTPVIAPYLSPLQQLVKLSLELTLDDEGVRALATLPALTDVAFAGCVLRGDVSREPCKWQCVQFHRWYSPPYQELAWLPLGSTTRLYQLLQPLYNMQPGSHRVVWRSIVRWYPEASEDLDTTCHLLHRAAQVLARLGKPIFLVLSRPSMEAVVPSPSLLQALSPLGQVCDSLELHEGWMVEASLAHTLALHLPRLSYLRVNVEGPSFPGFAIALGSTCVHLYMLILDHVPHPLDTAKKDGFDAALLSMAAARASNPQMGLLQIGGNPGCGGVQWGALAEEVHKRGLDDRVWFVPYCAWCFQLI